MKKITSLTFCALIMLALIPTSAEASFRPRSITTEESTTVEVSSFRPR